uniref:Uncharacterized protein n=1 Tax=Cacopsylla melanoneura TaxID=428564 RepID=A0A8D9BKH1_9HEMI
MKRFLTRTVRPGRESNGCFSLRVGAIVSSIVLLLLMGSMLLIEFTYMGGFKGLQRPGSIVNYLDLNWVYVTVVYLVLLIAVLLFRQHKLQLFFTWLWIVFTLVILSIFVTLVVNLVNQGWSHLTANTRLNATLTNPIYYLLLFIFGVFTLFSIYLAVVLYSYLKQLKLK